MKKIVKNRQGGINDMGEDALKRAQKVDLITLPDNVKGTNCFNCKWIRDKERDYGFCGNKSVLQEVNGRMCCILWTNTSEYRPFTRMKDFK